MQTWSRSRGYLLIAFVAGLSVGWFFTRGRSTEILGDRTAPSEPLPGSPAAAGESLSPTARAKPARTGDRRSSADTCAPCGPPSEGEAEYLEHQSSATMTMISERIAVLGKALPDQSPEAVVASTTFYRMGLADALRTAAPEVTGHLASKAKKVLCNSGTRDVQLQFFATLMGDMPEMADKQGLQCVLQRGKEDTILWSALDAWRAADIETTPELRALERTAIDERTKLRVKAIGSHEDVTAGILRGEPSNMEESQ